MIDWEKIAKAMRATDLDIDLWGDDLVIELARAACGEFAGQIAEPTKEMIERGNALLESGGDAADIWREMHMALFKWRLEEPVAPAGLDQGEG